MDSKKTNMFQALLIGSIFILLITNFILFLRMNQLQTQVLAALKPFSIPKGLSVGKKAPDFILNDLTEEKFSLRKEVTVSEKLYYLLVFSSPSCSACQDFWPELNQFNIDFPDVEIVMISKGTNEENEIIKQAQNFRFRILSWDEKVAKDYEIPGTPYIFLISKDMRIEKAGFSSDLVQIMDFVDNN